MTQLPFFPASLPDETLFSRVSRYHLVEGNRAASSTLRQLFGSPLEDLSKIVPSGISMLAGQMAGEIATNLQNLTEANTLLPLFAPFLGRSNSGIVDFSKAPAYTLARIPRHVVGQSGDSKLCPICAREDEAEHGISYWHRSHQVPGVRSCWRHRSKLLIACPSCRLPFQRKTRLLETPWLPCPNCAFDVTQSHSDSNVSDQEHAYALFASQILKANFRPIPADILSTAYRSAIQGRGFRRGSKTASAEYEKYLIEKFGDEFLSSVDSAFAAGKRNWWLRINIVDGQMDLPITRHLLICLDLFESPHRFIQAVQDAQKFPAERGRVLQLIEKDDRDAQRAVHRKKIRLEILRCPGIRMEQLWKRAYTSVAWLFENDRLWLTAVTDGDDKKSSDQTDRTDLQREDRDFAEVVAGNARRLRLLQSRPVRATVTQLLAGIPSHKVTSLENRRKYPLMCEQLDLNRESSWCFSARKILWSLTELNRLELCITLGNVRSISAVSAYAILMIGEFTKWDLPLMAESRVNIDRELTKAGIGAAWTGPSSIPMSSIAGRSYVRKR